MKMRKILSVFLAALMLMATLAVLPVAASEIADYERSQKDGTTVADAEAMDLVVTEYMSNTINTYTGGSASSSADAFQYIELYNRGEADINLYNLAVVAGKNKTSGDVWNKSHMFSAKLPIKAGNIYEGTKATNTRNACVNPNSAMLKPGEFAIIWFWNDATNSVSNANGKSLGDSYYDEATGKTIFHKSFRDHYRRQQRPGETPISDDLLIVAVYAGSSFDTTTAPTFALNKSSSWMYALVKNEAGNAFDYKTDKAFDRFYNKVDKTTSYDPFNEKILCMWQWGTNTALSIPTQTDFFEGKATVYVPANCPPDFRNASRQAIWDGAYEEKHNYYELGFVDGFKEVGMVHFMENPTIGSMDAWQWAYVDPDRAPADVKELAANGKTWQQVAIAAYNEANVVVPEDFERSEEDRNQGNNINVDRENLGNLGQNAVYVNRDDLGNSQENVEIERQPQAIYVDRASLGNQSQNQPENGAQISAYDSVAQQNAPATSLTQSAPGTLDTAKAPAQTGEITTFVVAALALVALMGATYCFFRKKHN